MKKLWFTYNKDDFKVCAHMYIRRCDALYMAFVLDAVVGKEGAHSAGWLTVMNNTLVDIDQPECIDANPQIFRGRNGKR